LDRFIVQIIPTQSHPYSWQRIQVYGYSGVRILYKVVHIGLLANFRSIGKGIQP
jgi:hypothetical protein